MSKPNFASNQTSFSSSNPSMAAPRCNQCGAELVIQKITTQKNEHSFAATAVTKYQCSNKECQEEIDKRTAKRIEIRTEQELARQKRLEKKN